MLDVAELQTYAKNNGQGHIFNFWSKLLENEKHSLIKVLENIDLKYINNVFHKASQIQSFEKYEELLPPEPEVCGSLTELRHSNLHLLDQYSDITISEGKVAVLLLAGGQGTRLGVQYPKGLYRPNLPSGRFLYQIQAERLLRVSQMCKEKFGVNPNIPWYIMTSERTKEKTMEFFKLYEYFGYDPENVIFFEQFTFPIFFNDGKILLESPSVLGLAPDGNGGLYKAIKDRGVLDDMKRRGIEYVQIYCVDNLLVKLPDLHFVGFCIDKSVSCAAQVVPKTDPQEPIGVVCRVNNRYQVVEYSELPPSMAALRTKSMANGDNLTENGQQMVESSANGVHSDRLVYSHGNICVHFMTWSFLEHVSRDNVQQTLTYHRVQKKVSHVDLESGDIVNPTKPNAIKMEKFVFDVFPFAENFAIWEVPREEQFSPLKNGPGALKDSPKTARDDLLNYHTQLAKEAGAQLLSESARIEISPLISYAGENLSCLMGVKLEGLNLLELDWKTGKPVLMSLD